MDDERRARFTAWFEGKPLLGDRKKFMKVTGLSKGRVVQLLDNDLAFGERAARNIARAFSLPDNFFELDQTVAPRPRDPTAPPPEPRGNFNDRREASDSDWQMLADLKWFPEDELNELREQIRERARKHEAHSRELLARFGGALPDRKPATVIPLQPAAEGGLLDKAPKPETKRGSR